MTEITLELTDFCPHRCGFCSSDAGPDKATYLDIEEARRILRDKRYDKINISGGEPVAHQGFYEFLLLAESHLNENGVVVVYSNAIQAIAYNATVLPGGVRVICNLPVNDSVDEIHALRLIEQGRAKTGGPRFHASGNFRGCTGCDHRVVRPDGFVAASPCKKAERPKEHHG
jgi:molybdenum cofactor biosynthesis enzyme MoaA